MDVQYTNKINNAILNPLDQQLEKISNKTQKNISIPNVIHKFVVKATPRFTLFKLKRINDTFDYFQGDIYFQGILNYGILIMIFMIILNSILLLYTLYIKAIRLERPNFVARHLYRVATVWSGLMVILLALLSLVGALIAYICWSRFNKKLSQAPLHNIACPYMKKIEQIPVKLYNHLLKGASASPSAEAVAQALGDNEITTEVDKINNYVLLLFDNMEKVEAHVAKCIDKLKPLCDHSKIAKIKMPKQVLVTLIGEISCSAFTIVLGGVLMKAIKFRSKCFITVLIVLAWLVMIVWGIIASAGFMFFLVITDVCIDPVHAAKVFLPTVHPNVTDDLVEFYLNCGKVHPFKPEFEAFKKSLDTLIENSDSLVKIFEIHSALKVHGEFARDFRRTLDEGFEVIDSIIKGDCRKSMKEFQSLLVLPCHYVFGGLAILFLAALLVTFFLTLFVVIFVRIRHFVKSFMPPRSKKPSDICPCPTTCPGPESDIETRYFMPEVKVNETECPPSGKAFSALLRNFTFGLNTKDKAKAERFACYPDSKKVYCDELGNLLPPECIPVEDKSVETENMYMCTQTLKKNKKGRKGKIKLHKKIIKGRMEKCINDNMRAPTKMSQSEEKPKRNKFGQTYSCYECVDLTCTNPNCERHGNGTKSSGMKKRKNRKGA
ncbi:hypothetical protein O0L34_g1894 [Tuta absoluta]|nr:hypothetical protein O0L34_g1894 [Tuta absoluta]